MSAPSKVEYRLWGVLWVNREQFLVDSYLKLFLLRTLNVPHQPRKVEEIWIQKMRGAGIHQGPEHHLPSAGTISLPTIENRLYLLAL